MKISIKEPTLLLKKLCKDKDKISIATKPEESLMAGETAMGHYTMLAEPATLVIAIDVRQRLEPYYKIPNFHVEGTMLYFRAHKQ